LLCTKSNFDYKLTFETADKTTFSKVIEYCELLEWETSPEMEKKRFNELHNWFLLYQRQANDILNLAQTLRMDKLTNFIKSKTNPEKSANKEDGLFKTEIGITNNKLVQTASSGKLEKTQFDELKTKNFEDASPPQYNEKNMCLEIPINLNLIKKKMQ